MTGPQDPAAAGRDLLRAGDADREQVIAALKNAFVQGRLTRDELGTRVGQALSARTYADLAALTADLPPTPAAPPAAGAARPPAPARRRPLARHAAGSGGCLVIMAAAMRVATLADPGNTPGPLPSSLAFPCLVVAFVAAFAALLIVLDGVGAAVEQRRSRRQLPPRPGQGGHARDGERRAGTGQRPAPPGPRTGQARADLRAHKPRRRRHVPAPAGRAPGGATA